MKPSRAGFTLVEMMFALLLLGVVGYTVSSFAQSSADAHRATSSAIALQESGRKGVNRIKELLVGARRASMFPDPESPAFTSTVDFQRDTSTSGPPTWGPTERIALELKPGEVQDGVDNDGDGLVDECQVVWIRNLGLADERRQKIVGRVSLLLGGEVENASDDNDNGMADEPGLRAESFVSRSPVARRSVSSARATSAAFSWRTRVMSPVALSSACFVFATAS